MLESISLPLSSRLAQGVMEVIVSHGTKWYVSTCYTSASAIIRRTRLLGEERSVEQSQVTPIASTGSQPTSR